MCVCVYTYINICIHVLTYCVHFTPARCPGLASASEATASALAAPGQHLRMYVYNVGVGFRMSYM